MREATIILPRVNATATAYIREKLLYDFGGYTEHKARGAWRDDATGKIHYDTSSVFTIGAEEAIDDIPSLLLLRDTALQAGEMAGQISVYLRGFDGNIEFVNCSHV